MDESARKAIDLVVAAFGSINGPARFRYPESGWWYEWEGKEIAKALLNLDPADLECHEVISPITGNFMPEWAAGEGLMWLIPGIVRVCFEAAPKSGAELLERLFTELQTRIRDGEITIDPALRNDNHCGNAVRFPERSWRERQRRLGLEPSEEADGLKIERFQRGPHCSPSRSTC